MHVLLELDLEGNPVEARENLEMLAENNSISIANLTGTPLVE